jgi:hypothetical protein
MHTIRAREYRRAFRVSSWDIERLVNLLGGDEKIRAIVVEFRDGSSTTLEHAGELGELPNPASRQIRRIWFESHPPAFLAQSDETPRLTIVELRDGGPYGVAAHVSGEEKAVRDLSLQLEQWADSISPWYGALAYVDRTLLAGGALLLLGGVASVGLLLGLLIAGSGPAEAWRSLPSLGVSARVAAGVGLVLLAGALARVGLSRERYFPRAQFRFGQGEERCRRANRRRGWVVGATVAVALITTLAATIASALL